MKSIEWFNMAEKFLKSAERNLEEGLYEIACFELHQAVELAFKAVYIKEYGSRPYTHDLTLLAQTLKYQDDFLALLSTMYTGARYPENTLTHYKDLGVQCVETARRALSYVKQRLEKKA